MVTATATATVAIAFLRCCDGGIAMTTDDNDDIATASILLSQAKRFFGRAATGNLATQ